MLMIENKGYAVFATSVDGGSVRAVGAALLGASGGMPESPRPVVIR